MTSQPNAHITQNQPQSTFTTPDKPLPNPLRLVSSALQAPANRTRFLFVGDATKPVTAIEVDSDVSSRYQIPNSDSISIQTPFRLKILHFNDLHGRISHLSRRGDFPVFSKIVSRYRTVQRKYAENPQAGALLLSAGDDMVGTPFDVLVTDHSHPYDLYQSVGVDAAVLGNHDLDLGTQTLAKIIQRSGNFPVLSANLHAPEQLQPWVYPAALLDVKGVRVGIIGLTTAAQMKGPDAHTLNFANPVQVVKNLLPVLRPYCHVLIVLSHLGYCTASTSATVTGYGDRQLAEHLPFGAVDLIIGGHTHHILNETGLSSQNIVNGIPIVQAGTLGRFLGEVTITLRDRHHAAVTDARLTVTADLPADQAFETEQIKPILTSLKNTLNRPLGQVMFHPDLGADVVQNDFASTESALANFVTAGMVQRLRAKGYQADFAMTDAAILKTGIPSKTLIYADWFALMPYADTLRLFQVTGQQLLDFLQDNARRANRWGEPHIERGFVQFSEQIRYKITLGDRAMAAKVEAVFVNGVPLELQLDRTFMMASHSFVRQLARGWEQSISQESFSVMTLDTLPAKDTGLFLREELIAYIEAQGGVLASGGATRDGRLIFG